MDSHRMDRKCVVFASAACLTLDLGRLASIFRVASCPMVKKTPELCASFKTQDTLFFFVLSASSYFCCVGRQLARTKFGRVGPCHAGKPPPVTHPKRNTTFFLASRTGSGVCMYAETSHWRRREARPWNRNVRYQDKQLEVKKESTQRETKKKGVTGETVSPAAALLGSWKG